MTAENISWGIAPRLNAAGRLDHASAGYKLLMAESPAEVAELARHLEEKNSERQRLTTQFVVAARDCVLSSGVSPLLFIVDEECPLGILGLVAGRLTDEFYRPSVVVRIEGDFATASCRSIPEFNITSAITRCREYLTHFGGHAQAAGFSLESKHLAQVRRKLSDIAASELQSNDLQPALDIDGEIQLSELRGSTYDLIKLLEPFGEGNRPPVFLSRGVKIIDARNMGSNGDHFKLRLRQKDSVWEAVAFRLAEELSPHLSEQLDIVYNLELDTWCGVDSLRLNIIDFTPASEKRAI